MILTSKEARTLLEIERKNTTKNARNGMRQAPDGEHFWHGGK